MTWFPTPDDPIFGFHTAAIIKEAVGPSPLANDLPGQQPWLVAIGRTSDIIVLRWQETGPTSAAIVDKIDIIDLALLVTRIGKRRTYAELKSETSLAAEFGLRKLLIVLDVVDGNVDGEAWVNQVVDWLEDEPASKAVDQRGKRTPLAG